MGARMLSVMLLSLSIHFSMLLLALLWRKRKYQISDNFPGDGPTISKNNDSSPKPIAPGQVQVYWYWGYNIDVSCALLVLRCWQQTLTMLLPPQSAVPRALPKRPGAMPPFALFSQEMRAKLQVEHSLWLPWSLLFSLASFICDQADDPNIGFGDLGRRLGEMWHALEENEKEDYRRRARLLSRCWWCWSCW